MTELEIKRELEVIIAEIKVLKSRKKELTDKLMGTTDNFLTKFNAWYDNEDNESECHHGWVISEKDFPLIRARMDNWDIDRYRTYYLEEIIDEEKMWILDNPEDFIKENGQEEYDKTVEEIQPMLEEAMKGNMKSFTYDW